MTNLFSKNLAQVLRPTFESVSILYDSMYSKLQNTSEQIVDFYADVISRLIPTENQIKIITTSLDLFAKALSELNYHTVAKEDIEIWKTSYIKWGKIGWPVIYDAPVNLFSTFPINESMADGIAMQYCNDDLMNDLFKNLKKADCYSNDLETSIFCYKNRQYKACSLILFSIIDGIVIRYQPETKGNWSPVGLTAINKLKTQFDNSTNEDIFFYFNLYNTNLFACLQTYFAKNTGFIEEPDIINRNFLMHGMSNRKVTKKDCIQLFLTLYNIILFLDL